MTSDELFQLKPPLFCSKSGTKVNYQPLIDEHILDHLELAALSCEIANLSDDQTKSGDQAKSEDGPKNEDQVKTQDQEKSEVDPKSDDQVKTKEDPKTEEQEKSEEKPIKNK